MYLRQANMEDLPQLKAVYQEIIKKMNKDNVHYSRKGIGSAMLREAAELARKKGAEYLRLFVVDINEPAINLYLKNGFKRGNGIYEERIDEDYVLREIGFEMKVGL